MKLLLLIIATFVTLSCATKKYSAIRQLPSGVTSATEEKYFINDNHKELQYRKEFFFTKNGRIRYSKTLSASGDLIQETKKKLWFVVEIYPNEEPYYCKTRWKFKQRERISCYTQKRHKKTEAIYHYNKNGTIAKIVDYYPPLNTLHFYYNDTKLTKIITKDRNENDIEELLITCELKDEKGTCIKEIRTNQQKGYREEIYFYPVYE
ncbi:hypothetical protein [Flavobacterium sp. UMI-01]|uniref:hypothetical protein n=1 Tax=Flavobacterium sp. UMI-01 TaxID=1441053 RepID=UPI001C7DC06B|nr:hypothetical protein [Flavobacterium sp. UMI-01]GIZ08701.1 hypothetical protein FUMI01_14280 [Flavobacterium sp. UMI-01]